MTMLGGSAWDTGAQGSHPPPPKAWDYSSQRQVLNDKKEMDFRRRSFLNELQKKVRRPPKTPCPKYQNTPMRPTLSSSRVITTEFHAEVPYVVPGAKRKTAVAY